MYLKKGRPTYNLYRMEYYTSLASSKHAQTMLAPTWLFEKERYKLMQHFDSV